MKQLHILLIVSSILYLWHGTLQASSYVALDKKIVAAYNSDPKRSQDIYIYAMQILEKTHLDSSSKGRNWATKAQKLITIACYLETDRAIDNNNNHEAYLWAMRGVAHGAARGTLDSIAIKSVYDFLNDVVKQLSQTAAIKDQKYGKTMRQVEDYRTVKPASKLFSRDQKDLTGQRIEKNRAYTVQEGPTQDSSGKLYVKIRTDFGSILTIKYYVKRGWQIVNPPNAGNAMFYPSWQTCAAANSKIKNLNAIHASTIKNRHLESKIYFIPAKQNNRSTKKRGDE